MPGNEGGRATQDPDEILDRRSGDKSRDTVITTPAPPQATLDSAQSERNAAIAYVAAHRLFEAAVQVESAEASAEISPTLTDAYARVLEVFGNPDLPVAFDVRRQLQGAVQALARAATTAKAGRHELKTYAAGLVRVMNAHGIATGDAMVDMLTGESADTHARNAIRAAIERIERLRGTLGTIPAKYSDEAVAHEAGTIATLLYEASAQVNQHRRQGRGRQRPDASTVAEAEQLHGSVEKLAIWCRNVGVEVQPSQLDLVLRGADDAREAAGLERSGYLASYYGGQTPAGRDASARGPGSETVGSQHVENIIAWLSDGRVSSMLYANLDSIVNEPPIKKEPSFFEELLIGVITQALQLGPSLAFKAVTGLATSALKGKPAKVPQGLATEPFGLGDLERLQSGLPERVAPAASLLEPTHERVRGLGAAMVSKLSDKGAGAVKEWIGEQVKTSLGAGASLSAAFMKIVQRGAVEDMKARFSEADELRESLAMVPPEELQAMFREMVARAQEEAAARQADLVMMWASFVAKARLGHDSAETLDTYAEESHDWPAALGEKEGAVQIPVTVRLRPEGIRPTGTVTWTNTPKSIESMEVGGVELNGMSKSALATLREAKIPLGKAKLYRLYDVTVIYDYAVHSGGMFDVSPEGVVDARRVNAGKLAHIGRASGSVWGTAPNVVGVDDPFVHEAIRMIMKLDVDTGAIK